MKRSWLLVVLWFAITLCISSRVEATFTFTNEATSANDPLSDIENTEGRLEELADYVNDVVPTTLPTPITGNAGDAIIIDNGATTYSTVPIISISGTVDNGLVLVNNGLAAYTAILGDSTGNGLEFGFVLRSNADLLNNGGIGSIGQYLASNGDGTTEWQTVSTLTDGDKTDITVATNGTVFSIDNGAVTINDLGTTGFPLNDSTSAINIQTGTTYTVLDADNGRIVGFNNGSAITVTIPDTIGTNFTCTIMQLGNGAVTVNNGGTLVLRNSLGLDTLLGRWSSASVLRVSNGTDLLLFGELTP